MKKTSLFFLLIGCLMVVLLYMDWLKGTYFKVHYHSFFIQLKTFVLIIGGAFILKCTLNKASFLLFIKLYAFLWSIYFVLKLLVLIGNRIIDTPLFQIDTILTGYISITQLLTPIPFVVFWLLNKVYLKSHKTLNS